MSASPTAARIRRQCLARGLTKLPQCPICLGEVPLHQFVAHTTKCTRPAQQPPPAAQVTVNGANGTVPAQEKGLVYGLFDKAAVARLELAGTELAYLRKQLRDEHDSTTPEVRVERCRELARRECLSMALILTQVRRQFALQGSGMVFLRNLRPHVVNDHLREACSELVRMGDPKTWRIT